MSFELHRGVGNCPDASAFRQAVAKELGHDPFRDDAPRTMLARVFGSDGRVSGTLQWRDLSGRPSGERKFTAHRGECAHMIRVMALAAAIQIQLFADAEPAAEREPPPSKAQDAPASSQSEAPAALVAPPSDPVPTIVAPTVVAPQKTRTVSEPTPDLPVTAKTGDGQRDASPPLESRVAVDLGLSALHDFGDYPNSILPRLSFWWIGRSGTGVRVTGGGLGPVREVSQANGRAQLDRTLLSVAMAHIFRPGELLQPFLLAGAGVQDVAVHGISLAPDTRPAHDSHAVSILVVAGGGVSLSFAERWSLIAEAQALFFRPAIQILIDPDVGARMSGTTLLFSGGVLARF